MNRRIRHSGFLIRGRAAAVRQAGLTLVELMISITLGFLVVMAATALLLSTKTSYTAQDEGTRLQDTGRYAIESIARAVRQAAHEDWRQDEGPILSSGDISANIVGLDASRLKKDTFGIESPLDDAVNGSDVLAVRFFGAGSGENGDGTIVNCGGFGVPAATSQSMAETERGWSIFYVAKSESGEPELYCKWHGEKEFTAQAIARGVESFQVLYGLDTNGDALPNHFVRAAVINDLDDALALEGADDAAKAIDKNRKSHWKKVVAIKVALLMRGSQPAREDALTAQYDLFGKEYSDKNANTDTGTRIKEAGLSQSVRNRFRKVFTATIQLRNQSAGSGT